MTSLILDLSDFFWAMQKKAPAAADLSNNSKTNLMANTNVKHRFGTALTLEGAT